MTNKLALIIGNSHYQDPNLAKLVTPGEDVSDLALVLRDPAIGGFDQVLTLIDETDAAIRLSIEDFFADKKPDDLLVLYFSGHGVRDEQGRLYLAAPNTRANRLRATAIAADFITAEMDRSRSKRQVLILDCCHSGAFAQGAKAVTGGTVGTGPAFEGTGYGRVVLTATDATQYAWEGDKVIGEADNSVFTHYLVQGLQTGEADVDADGRITLDELYDYVYAQVVAQTPKQTPGKWSYKQQGDMVIARNPKPIVKPAELPADLRTALESPLANVRAGALRELDRLLNGSNAGLALAAFEAIKHLVEDDSRTVSTAASSVLNAYADRQRAREEQERLAKEKAEQERQAALKAEADRQAALKAEQERLAAEKAEQERQAALKAEADRQAALKAEQERLAAEKAEQERQAALKAEADRQAVLKAEQERLAAGKAEQERQREEALDTARRQAVSTARMVVQSGPNAGQTFTLQHGVNIIGRMAGAAVRLTDVLISRQHVRLNVEAKRITLEDLGSANGTYVNAQRIADDAPVTLHDGDTIAIGDTVLVLQATSSMPTPQPRPAPVTPSVELPTQIATAPPKSMAEQLVADQSARLAPTGGLRRTAVPVTPVQPQYTKPAAALPISIVKPTLITAGCFGLILALAVIPLRAAGDLPDSLVWLGMAIVLQWLTIDLAWRQLGVKTTRGRLLGVMACWAIAGAAGLGAAYALVGTISNISGADEIIAILLIATTFAAICGSLGGLLTSRVLGPVIPQLQTKATTLGWLLAWVIGIGVATLMLNQSQGANLEPALAICGALIGAIGGGTMFWQIAQTDQPARLAVVRQPIGSSRPAADVSTARHAIASICGGWVAIGLLAVLLAQSAQSAADTATYLCLGYGLGCGALGYVLPRVVPSLRRAAWQLAGGWALVLIGAILLGVIVQLESNWLSMAGVGLCGVIAAWVVCADVPGVPRWHYAVIGVIWLLAYVIGSGYAWHMVTYKAATHGWSLAATLDAMGSSVFALVLGAVLSAAIGGVALYRVLLRARA